MIPQHIPEQLKLVFPRCMKAEILKVLKGIDKTECEDESGWWETPQGAMFGTKKLAELLSLFDKHDTAANQQS